MKLFWTARALRDIANIDQWLTQHASQQLAIDQLERVRQRARQLRNFPSLGPHVEGGTRPVRVAKTPYVLAYRINDDLIEILRIHHDRQNWRPPE